jgi:hypothetical protein
MFSGRNTPLALLAAALVLAFALTACGSSDSTSSSSSTTTSSDPPAANSGAQVSTKKGSKQFLKKGSSTNELVKFGKEAPATEREAASAVITENLVAREAGDFKTQCATMALLVAENVARPKKGAAATKACPADLEKLALPLNKTEPFRINTLEGEIASLRVKGNLGAAYFHGNDGKDYEMPMFKEGVGWKVAALQTTELNPPEPKSPREAGEPNQGASSGSGTASN